MKRVGRFDELRWVRARIRIVTAARPFAGGAETGDALGWLSGVWPAAASAAAEGGSGPGRMDERSFTTGTGVRRTARKKRKTQVYVSPEASGNVLPFGRLAPEKAWSTQEEADLVRIVERDGFGGWKSKTDELGTGRCPDMVRAKAKAIRAEKDKALSALPDGLLPVGTPVEALYHHVKPHKYSAWYRAKITKVDKRGGTYVIDWEDGDANLRTQPAQNVRPLPWGALPLANAENADAEREADGEHSRQHRVHARETDQKNEKSPQQRTEEKAAAALAQEEGVEIGGDSTDNSEGAEEDDDGSEEVEGEDEEINEDEEHGEGHWINRQQGEERYGDGRGRRVAWSQDEQNQLRKMLRAGRKDWEAMGACIGRGRTGSATKQFAMHLRAHNDLKIDKRSANFTEWKVMSQPIERKGGCPSWRHHCCIDAAILERWAGADRYRTCPTQREVRDDPLLCIDIKRASILKRCVNGTARSIMRKRKLPIGVCAIYMRVPMVCRDEDRVPRLSVEMEPRVETWADVGVEETETG